MPWWQLPGALLYTTPPYAFPPLWGSRQTPQLNRSNPGMGRGEREDWMTYYGIFRVSLLSLALSWALWFGGVLDDSDQITGWGR